MTRAAAIRKKEEELKILAQLSEEIKKNPALGLKIGQQAGIWDENGQLTEHYKQPENEH